MDRAIEAAKLANRQVELPEILVSADKLANYCYIPDKDLEDHCELLFELVRANADEVKINAITGTLEHIKESLANDKAVQETLKTEH